MASSKIDLNASAEEIGTALGKLYEEHKDFYVYDNRGSEGWGNSIKLGRHIATEAGPVRSINGWKERIPKDGDRLVHPQEGGKLGLYLIFNVTRAREPRDMFSADVAFIDPDYQGGYGLRGEEKSEIPPFTKLQAEIDKINADGPRLGKAPRFEPLS